MLGYVDTEGYQLKLIQWGMFAFKILYGACVLIITIVACVIQTDVLDSDSIPSLLSSTLAAYAGPIIQVILYMFGVETYINKRQDSWILWKTLCSKMDDIDDPVLKKRLFREVTAQFELNIGLSTGSLECGPRFLMDMVTNAAAMSQVDSPRYPVILDRSESPTIQTDPDSTPLSRLSRSGSVVVLTRSGSQSTLPTVSRL